MAQALDTLDVMRRLRTSAAAALRDARSPSLERLRVLSLLRAGPMPAGDLARLSRLTPPAITDVADGLVADGLIVRRADSRDRRVVLHEMTGAGRRELRRAEKIAATRVADVLSRMDPTTRDQFAKGIRALRGILEDLEA